MAGPSTAPEVHGVLHEARRRRTFAIISHPDAGKTTLSEKLLLYGGAVTEAGMIKARSNRRGVVSDWLDVERERGISVSSTILRFEHQGVAFNLLDTPGHRDFSEDTLRVLGAADSAVILLDAAKGVEERTLKLFQVARERHIPLLTFVNKFDRPGLDPLSLVDEIEAKLQLKATPVTWPVGRAGEMRGIVDRRDGSFYRFQRTTGGATAGAEERLDMGQARREEGAEWAVAEEEMQLLDAVDSRLDLDSFLRGASTPVFFGSALSNFGVRLLLHALINLAPPPLARDSADGVRRPIDAPFSGIVFKVQSNLDPRHRDKLAFLRICSGRFERGMRATLARTGRPLTLSYAHELFGRNRETIETGYPGDVIGLVNAGGLRVGDTLYAGEPVRFPPIPTLAPDHFARVRNRDTSKYKQFRRGLKELGEEGVVQVLHERGLGAQATVLAGAGPMQFEVAQHRLESEFGALVAIEPAPWRLSRRISAEDVPILERSAGGGMVLERPPSDHLAVFRDRFELGLFEKNHPGVQLDPFMLR